MEHADQIARKPAGPAPSEAPPGAESRSGLAGAQHQRKPAWLKVRLPTGPGYTETLRVARANKLHTVCEDAMCPNIAECWSRKTATFMILGDICTRACGFCSVKSGLPTELDLDEPRRTAEAIRDLGIRHAVITSVNRDELADGGAAIFAETVRQTRALAPSTRVELLTPDFKGDLDALRIVWEARPDVFGHNVECVARLQKQVRSGARWERSLHVLRETKRQGTMLVKTGIQVGHSETWDELLESFDSLASIGLDILTIGQYLQPTKQNLPVRRYYTPDEFDRLKDEAKRRGIRYVQSGPLVRSSYRAEEPFDSGGLGDALAQGKPSDEGGPEGGHEGGPEGSPGSDIPPARFSV